MTSLWLGVATLTLLAVMLVVVPLWRHAAQAGRQRRWLWPSLLTTLLLAALCGYTLSGYWRDVAAGSLLANSSVNDRSPEQRRAIIRYLSKSLRRQPDNVMLTIQLGLELQASGNFRDALTLFKIALAKKDTLKALGIEKEISNLVNGLERLRREAQPPPAQPPPPSSKPTEHPPSDS